MTTKTKKTSNPSSPPAKRTPAKGRRSGKTAKDAADALAKGPEMSAAARALAKGLAKGAAQPTSPALEVRFLEKHEQKPEVWPAGVVHSISPLGEGGGIQLLNAQGGMVTVYPPKVVHRCTPVTQPQAKG